MKITIGIKLKHFNCALNSIHFSSMIFSYLIILEIPLHRTNACLSESVCMCVCGSTPTCLFAYDVVLFIRSIQQSFFLIAEDIPSMHGTIAVSGMTSISGVTFTRYAPYTVYTAYGFLYRYWLPQHSTCHCNATQHIASHHMYLYSVLPTQDYCHCHGFHFEVLIASVIVPYRPASYCTLP